MGLTPLDGLVMGTRSGNIDASLIKFMMDETGMSVDEVTNELNKNSGLKGICGKNDLRDIEKLYEAGDERAKIAVEKIKNIIENTLYLGMPEVVNTYIKNKNFSGTLAIQKQLLKDYEEDITKYVEESKRA